MLDAMPVGTELYSLEYFVNGILFVTVALIYLIVLLIAVGYEVPLDFSINTEIFNKKTLKGAFIDPFKNIFGGKE